MAKKSKKELDKSIRNYHLTRVPLTMRQARLVLNNENVLSSVESAIASLPDAERAVAEIEWNYGDKIYRYDDWFVNVTKQMNITSNKMDTIFYKGYDL